MAPKQNLGWLYQILPYIGETGLWQMTNDTIRQKTAVAPFCCPSRSRIRVLVVSYASNELRTMADYAGNAGTDNQGGDGWSCQGQGRDAPITANGNGVVTPANIVNGFGVTLLLGEKCLNADHLMTLEPTRTRAGPAAGISTSCGGDSCRPRLDYNDITEGYTKGWGDGDTGDEMLYATFGSGHAGSSNYAMCDGSVRPIDYGIDIHVFEKLSSRDWRLPTSVLYNPKFPPPIPVSPMDFQ